MKLPAGTTIISGQSVHSLKASFGFSASSLRYRERVPSAEPIDSLL